MKNKPLLSLFFIALILVVSGAIFKDLHWSLESNPPSVGLFYEVVFILVLLFKITSDNKSDFLNT
jgi:hypothetical protein